MPQVGAARNKTYASLDRHRLQPPQDRLIAFCPWIARAFADIDAMNKYRIANIGRVVRVIELVVSHQHVQAVDAAGKQGDGSARRIGGV